MGVSDPGPPTWKEAMNGHQADRAKAGDMIRRAKEAMGRLPAGEAGARAETLGMLMKAESDWKHWNEYHAKAASFTRVHPAMADDSIYAKCSHGLACFSGADNGWYREPALTREPARAKEMGDDE